MYLLIRYPGGIIAEGVVLAMGKNRLRIVVAGFPETMELKRAGTQWFAAKDRPVEFDFLMSDTHQAVTAPVTKAVGMAMDTGLAQD